MTERYDVAGYLDYQGESFTRRFDANSYLALSRPWTPLILTAILSADTQHCRVRAQVLLIGIS
jgi:homoserine acetyltransferase